MPSSIRYVITYNEAVADQLACQFATSFYSIYARLKNVERSFDLAKKEMTANRINIPAILVFPD
jgi:plasmid maintenance system antidote protein VapI